MGKDKNRVYKGGRGVEEEKRSGSRPVVDCGGVCRLRTLYLNLCRRQFLMNHNGGPVTGITKVMKYADLHWQVIVISWWQCISIKATADLCPWTPAD
jgi:hypothetical protein